MFGIDAPEYVPPYSILEVGVHKNAYTVRVMDAGAGPRKLGEMTASSFWLYISIICIIVVGATVGGAVGGTMAVKNRQVVAASKGINTRQHFPWLAMSLEECFNVDT